jgi:hypothetical protein
VREALAKRAGFICSNPGCKVVTIGPSLAAEGVTVYIGKAAHITAAAAGGPRYDPTMSSGDRKSIGNAIFLCSACADIIDRNGGADHSVAFLRRWKTDHDEWVAAHLNKRYAPEIAVIDGEHGAEGKGLVIGLDAQGPVFFQPGTRTRASGEGTIIGTRIGGRPPTK